MQTDLPEFIDRIFDGYAVLFLGSGFSAHAKNRHEEALPSGTSLARLLREKLEFPSEYPLDVLAREYTLRHPLIFTRMRTSDLTPRVD